MNYPTRQMLTGILLTLALGGTLTACGNDDTSASTSDTNPGAATTATSSTAPGADVDQAFVRQMVPHHQMAVVMAQSALKHADHTQLKTLSSAIIGAQKKEITELSAIGEDLGTKTDHRSLMGSDADTLGLSMDEMGMSMDMNGLDTSGDFDRDFIDEMTVHHTGAIAMAKAEMAHGSDQRLKTIATAIITAQEKEIARMSAWRAEWFGSADASPSTTPADESMHHMDS